MSEGSTPPVAFASNSVGVAFVWAENTGYIFYYDQFHHTLHIAHGKEGAGYSAKPIVVGPTSEYIRFNDEPTPTPLAAGYNKLSDSRREIRVYYVQKNGQIGEVITEDFGKTWKQGALSSKAHDIALPGGLAAHPGERWRVIVRMKDTAHTLVELYQTGDDSWDKYIIP